MIKWYVLLTLDFIWGDVFTKVRKYCPCLQITWKLGQKGYPKLLKLLEEACAGLGITCRSANSSVLWTNQASSAKCYFVCTPVQSFGVVDVHEGLLWHCFKRSCRKMAYEHGWLVSLAHWITKLNHCTRTVFFLRQELTFVILSEDVFALLCRDARLELKREKAVKALFG